LANYDADSIVVYQAYKPAIGDYAVRHGRLDGPEFSPARMSWVKPNFLWMMYRSGWGTKPGQEITLGLRLRRIFFDELLTTGVPSSHVAAGDLAHADWQAAVASSEVRLQWDPDHGPRGEKLARRAIQLGLRGECLRRLSSAELLEVTDMTQFVATQRAHVESGNLHRLETPEERVYLPLRA
jgi:hypothetical protein